MEYLDEVELIDFKTYEHGLIKFSPGVNVITGDSGQGKTNLLLAMNWVLNDRPRGDGCIRRGQTKAQVTCTVRDGDVSSSVIRTRGKSENSYVIEQNGERVGDPFTVKLPPEEAITLLDMSDINIQKQRDQHFLVYSPPGQVAAYIRSITKLDEIDQVSKIVSSDIRSEKTEIAHQQTKLDIINAKLKVIDEIDLATLVKKIKKAKGLLLKIEQIKEKRVKIKSIVDALKVLEEQRIVIPKDVNKLFVKAEKYSTKINLLLEQKIRFATLLNEVREVIKNKVILPKDLKISIAEKSIVKVEDLRRQKRSLSILLDEIQKVAKNKVVLPDLKKIVSTAESCIETYNSMYEKIEKIMDLQSGIEDVRLKIKVGSISLKSIENEKKELEKQLEVCPECGTALSKESKKKLLER